MCDENVGPAKVFQKSSLERFWLLVCEISSGGVLVTGFSAQVSMALETSEKPPRSSDIRMRVFRHSDTVRDTYDREGNFLDKPPTFHVSAV